MSDGVALSRKADIHIVLHAGAIIAGDCDADLSASYIMMWMETLTKPEQEYVKQVARELMEDPANVDELVSLREGLTELEEMEERLNGNA